MKTLTRNLAILIGYCFVVACPMTPQGAGPSGNVARALIGPPMAASGESGGGQAGGDSGGGDHQEGGGSADGGGAQDQPSSSGVAADTPIVVSGTATGMIPGPGCGRSAQTKLFFGPDVQTAITGETDELGRNIIFVKGNLYTQLGSQAPEGIGGQYINFYDTSTPDSVGDIGRTATWNGCFFAKIHASPNAAGKVLRLKSSIFVCIPGIGDSIKSNTEATVGAMMAKLEEGEPAPGRAEPLMTHQHTSFVEATYDLTIPAVTEFNTLEACPGPTNVTPPVIKGSILQNAIEREQRREEKANQDSSKPWDSGILHNR